jgi:hypothetical protein
MMSSEKSQPGYAIQQREEGVGSVLRKVSVGISWSILSVVGDMRKKNHIVDSIPAVDSSKPTGTMLEQKIEN